MIFIDQYVDENLTNLNIFIIIYIKSEKCLLSFNISVVRPYTSYINSENIVER